MLTLSLKNLLLTLTVLTAIAAACFVSYRAGAKSTALERTGPNKTGPIAPARAIVRPRPDATGKDSVEVPKWPN